MKKENNLHSTILNWKVIASSLFLLIISIILFWVSEKYCTAYPVFFGKVIPSFSSVLASSGIFALIYEILIRVQQTKFVLESIQLKDTMLDCGFNNLHKHYLDCDFTSLMEITENISVFAIYSQTWFNRYNYELVKYLSNKNKTLILCVPSLDNKFLEVLSEHFGYKLEELKKRILDSITICYNIYKSGKLGINTNIEIYIHLSRPAYTAYLFDNILLLGYYYSCKQKRRRQMIEFNSRSELYNEIKSDISEVINSESELLFSIKDNVDKIEEYFKKL